MNLFSIEAIIKPDVSQFHYLFYKSLCAVTIVPFQRFIYLSLYIVGDESGGEDHTLTPDDECFKKEPLFVKSNYVSTIQPMAGVKRSLMSSTASSELSSPMSGM